MAGHGSAPPEDRGDNSSRKVHEGWAGTGRYQISGYHGRMTGQETRSHEGHAVTSWESGPEQHVGLVEHEQPAGFTGRGVDVTSYAAGPYRTQLRAQVAASALSERVAGGHTSRTEAFRGSTTHWSHNEL